MAFKFMAHSMLFIIENQVIMEIICSVLLWKYSCWLLFELPFFLFAFRTIHNNFVLMTPFFIWKPPLTIHTTSFAMSIDFMPNCCSIYFVWNLNEFMPKIVNLNLSFVHSFQLLWSRIFDFSRQLNHCSVLLLIILFPNCWYNYVRLYIFFPRK